MSSDAPLEHLDEEFDQELGLAPETPFMSAQATGGQKLALIIAVGLFVLLALLHLLSLVLVVFSGESSIVVWAARFSSMWAGIFGSGFIAYILVLAAAAVCSMYKPEFLHPRILELSTREKLMALVPLVPVGLLYLANKALVSYLIGRL